MLYLIQEIILVAWLCN